MGGSSSRFVDEANVKTQSYSDPEKFRSVNGQLVRPWSWPKLFEIEIGRAASLWATYPSRGRPAAAMYVPPCKCPFRLTLSMGVGEHLPHINSDPGERAQGVAGREQDERHDKIVRVE